MSDNVIKVVRDYDDSFTIYVNGEDVMSADHDRHGWSGMEDLETLAKRIASKLNVEFVTEYSSGDDEDGED